MQCAVPTITVTSCNLLAHQHSLLILTNSSRQSQLGSSLPLLSENEQETKGMSVCLCVDARGAPGSVLSVSWCVIERLVESTLHFPTHLLPEYHPPIFGHRMNYH